MRFVVRLNQRLIMMHEFKKNVETPRPLENNFEKVEVTPIGKTIHCVRSTRNLARRNQFQVSRVLTLTKNLN